MSLTSRNNSKSTTRNQASSSPWLGAGGKPTTLLPGGGGLTSRVSVPHDLGLIGTPCVAVNSRSCLQSDKHRGPWVLAAWSRLTVWL